MKAMSKPALPAPGRREVELQALEATRRWVDRAVIGMNLCPFAKAVRRKRQIRFVVSPARTRAALAAGLTEEAQLLAGSDPARLDTTLLIHPYVLKRFVEYNDFLDMADAILVRLRLEGVLQIASFHPQYRFDCAPARDMAHYTNRSPYPMLHLLREASVSRAVDSVPNVDDIVQRNVQTLRELGREGWLRRTRMP
jgi:hypothetical protein